MSSVTDEDLLARQAALQDRAREALAALDLGALTADAGPLLVTGSFVSGLMCWPEVDVMVLVGPDYSPRDVMALLARIGGDGAGLAAAVVGGTRCGHRRSRVPAAARP